MKIINGFMVGFAAIFVIVTAIPNRAYKENRSGYYPGPLATLQMVSTKWEWFLVFSVFIFESIIAVFPFENAQQFGKNLDLKTSNVKVRWTFGQIVLLLMESW